MLTEIVKNPKYEKVLISTGNILNMLDNTTALKNSKEELVDSLKMCSACTDKTNTRSTNSNVDEIEFRENEGQVLRANRELKQKITENDRSEISIGVKLFLKKYSSDDIKEAINAVMKILDVNYIDNVVLAYRQNEANATATATATATTQLESTEEVLKNSIKKRDVDYLKEVWHSFEEFALTKQINQLGISDLDTEALNSLCQTARVPPTIAQITLASCCVVPPALKDFCTQHDIQLLTHSDPEVLLADHDFIIPSYTVNWLLRYQVHVRCRGVLIAKGYIITANKCPTAPPPPPV